MRLTPLPTGVATRLPHPTLAPLVDRLDHIGIVEHSRGAEPTAEFGHCTDDAGRALGLAVQLSADPGARVLASACLRQLDRSLQNDGSFVLRIDDEGQPTDDAPSEDATARALWGLAMATTDSAHPAQARAAARILSRSAPFESEHPRAAAHAVLAGAALLSSDPASTTGRQLVDVNFTHVPRSPHAGQWPWPEERLSSGNALLPEAMIVAGQVFDDDHIVVEAVELLEWLVDLEWSVGGHFSFTPTTGRGVGDGAGFDQQPIEAWALATACQRAFAVTGDAAWCDAIGWAAAWFDGQNDVGVQMWDARTGAAYDGLTPTGVNLNQGTESTLAFIGTLHAHRDTTGASMGEVQTLRSASR